jgi:hypothetical protein
MKYLTINSFADFKHVTRVTVSRNISKGRIEIEFLYGRKLIPLNKKNLAWTPYTGAGWKLGRKRKV